MTTLTLQLSDEVTGWLHERALQTGQTEEQVAAEQLEKAQLEERRKLWSKFAGIVEGGPPDLSTREGFEPR